MERYGFIRDVMEIKYLILFVLKNTRAPVPMDVIVEASLCDGGVDYFELVDAFRQLRELGHILETDNPSENATAATVKLFSLTDKGARTEEAVEKSIPFSVRRRALAQLSEAEGRHQRDSAVSAHTVDGEDGLFTLLTLRDDTCEVMSLRLSVASRGNAERIEKNFKKHAEKVFSAVLDALLADYTAD